ncbi:MAG TPA: virulence protein [Caproicibacter sp.]|nr:virulence protein [Caproicibacter sp.]
MEIRYNVTGERRKELAKAISEITGLPAVYKRIPTYAFEIGAFTVDKEGTLLYDDEVDRKMLNQLTDGLTERGFERVEPSDGLTIEIPLDGFTDESLANLEKLIASKATLIKKSLGVDALPVERTETMLKFSWFNSGASGEEVAAYTRLLSALCALAKEQKRVNAREKPVENEKFAFRVFLIRLGFVGDEYKAARKLLLKNLSGNSAFKSGAPAKAEAADE